MQRITPHLWFDTEAVEAAEYYASIFGKGSKIKTTQTLRGTPSGSVDVVTFELLGLEFMAISAGPEFKINPSVSFSVAFKRNEEVDELWNELSRGGKTLMELGSYPFSERYGWLQDKYGVSWQLIAMGDRPIHDKITPVMMFVGDKAGKAEEAMNHYVSVFNSAPTNFGKSKVGDIFRYTADQAPDKEGTVAHAGFTLAGQSFAAMDSARSHQFRFNEAVSFVVNCKTQEEIDYFSNKMSTDLQYEQCGWIKDKYGFSWQIVPVALNQLLDSKDREKVDRVTQAFLKMKRFNIEELERAGKGQSRQRMA